MLQDYPSPSCITWLFSCVFLALLCTHTNTHYIFSHFWLYSALTRTHIIISHTSGFTLLYTHTNTHLIFSHPGFTLHSHEHTSEFLTPCFTLHSHERTLYFLTLVLSHTWNPLLLSASTADTFWKPWRSTLRSKASAIGFQIILSQFFKVQWLPNHNCGKHANMVYTL